MFPSHDYLVNGVRLHTIQAGSQDGDLVILLHGFPEFWRAWEKQIPALARAGFRVLVPDQRGYNQSDKPAGVRAYSLDQLAGDVLGLAKTSGSRRAALVGHDWGAVVAWQVASSHPGVVRRLVVLNGPHPQVMIRTLRHSWPQRRRSWYILFFQLPWLPEIILRARGYRAMARMLQATSRPGAFPDELLRRYVEAWSQPGALTSMLNWYRAAVRFGLREALRPPELPTIQVPTLLLWGRQDTALGDELAGASIAQCPAGQMEICEQATHWIHHEEPEWVNERLVDFLGKGS